MSLNYSPNPLDDIFSWFFTRRSASGKALAFSAPVVVFVLIVTSFSGGGVNTSTRPLPTSAATTTQAQSRVEVADAQQPRSGPVTAVNAVTPTMPEPALSAKPTPPPLVGEMATYTVVAGDIPLTIAEKLGVPGEQRLDWAHQLLTLNKMTSTELQVGQVLKLPANTPSRDSPKSVEPTATNTSAPPSVPSPG